MMCLGESDQLEFDATTPRSVVHVNGNWLDLAAVELLDVSEGLFGEDRATFIFEGETLEREIRVRNT